MSKITSNEREMMDAYELAGQIDTSHLRLPTAFAGDRRYTKDACEECGDAWCGGCEYAEVARDD